MYFFRDPVAKGDNHFTVLISLLWPHFILFSLFECIFYPACDSPEVGHDFVGLKKKLFTRSFSDQMPRKEKIQFQVFFDTIVLIWNARPINFPILATEDKSMFEDLIEQKFGSRR